MIKGYLKVSGKAVLWVLLVCFLFGTSTSYASKKLFKDLQDISKAGQEAISRLKEALPEIKKISNENPNDSEVHQGVAELLRMLGYKYKDRAVVEYRKALALTPKAEHLYTGLIGVHLSKDMKEDKEGILNVLMKEAQQAEKLWPENAFYNYVKAYVFLEQKREKEAKLEIQRALNKPYMRQYRKSMGSARDKVLTLLNFPVRLKITINPSFCTSFALPMTSCAKYLNVLAGGFQENGNFKNAVELYNDSIKIFTLLEEDALLLHAVYQKNMLDIYGRIHNCYEKQGLQEKAEAILQKMEKTKDKRARSMQAGDNHVDFLITADEKEIEKEYERISEQGFKE